MDRDCTRRRALAALGSAGLAATAGCASTFVDRKETTETGTVDVGAATSLAVENQVGGITVETADRPDLAYRAHKKSSIQELNFDELVVRHRQDGDTLRVTGVHEEDDTVTRRNPVLDLTLVVPRSLSVVAAHGSYGDVTVAGTTGDLRASVGAGDLTVRGVDGDVRAEAGSGDLTVENVTGFAGGAVDSGNAEFTDLGGFTGANAGAGNLTVEVPALRDDARLEVGAGDLEARLAADLDAEVVVTADTGAVSATGLDVDVSRDGASARGEVTLGDGTHRLRIVSGAGDVDLSRLV